MEFVETTLDGQDLHDRQNRRRFQSLALQAGAALLDAGGPLRQ
jgi:hypothetical protein